MSKLSIVIPTEGRLSRLQMVLGSLLLQTEDDFDLHVIDDSGAGLSYLGDRIDDCRRRHGRDWFVHSINLAGAAKARNIGIKAAKSERVLFVDDDCVCPSNLVKVHAEASNKVALIGLRLHVPEALHAASDLQSVLCSTPLFYRPDRRNVAKLKAYIEQGLSGINGYAWTCHISYPMWALRQTGGFWEAMVGSGWEDRELALRCFRVGLRFDFLSEPQVLHLDHAQSPRQQAALTANRALFAETLRSKVTSRTSSLS